jgi:membrane-bound metal-dependent hydrolase YbcI (DUF457 family)
MKFISHKAINASVGIYFGLDITGIVLFIIGGVLPDIADRLVSGKSGVVFDGIHRTVSHWWLLWGIFYMSGYIHGSVVTYLSLGCLLHIFCDSLTKGGVPFLNPFKQTLGMRLFHTGSMIEYLLVTITVSLFLYLGVVK